MQSPWSLATMVLLGVLVGASLPVLFQLFLTLAETRRLLRRVGPRLDGTLAEIQETSRRLNRATTGIDESAQHARAILDAAGDLGRTIQQLNRMLRPAVILGGVVGPALVVAIKSLIERYGARADAGADGGSSDADAADEADITNSPTPEVERAGQGGKA